MKKLNFQVLISIIAFLAVSTLIAQATQIANGVLSVSPSVISQDTANVTFTFTLNPDSQPPPPPSNRDPIAVKIGTLSGTNINRVNDTNVTALFTIPADESVGFKDASVEFTNPSGTNEFMKTAAVLVLSTLGIQDVYVDIDNTGGPWDGTSWATAFQSVQQGIDSSTLGEIWVAEGTYTPGASRTSVITLKAFCKLYGGFDGTESDIAERNPDTHLTILGGDIGVQDNSADNCYHILSHTDSGSGVIVDGFTISDGNADGDLLYGKGGGLYCENESSPDIINCKFENNNGFEGGAVYCYNASSANLIDCVFANNTASRGGAICKRNGCGGTISNCTFQSNYATWRGGVFFLEYGSSPIIMDSFFTNNATAGNGGVLFSDDNASQVGTSSPVVKRCSFINNSAGYRGGVMECFNESELLVQNSDFIGNSAVMGGGACANDLNANLTLSNTITFTANSSDSGGNDVDSDSTSTTTWLTD